MDREQALKLIANEERLKQVLAFNRAPVMPDNKKSDPDEQDPQAALKGYLKEQNPHLVLFKKNAGQNPAQGEQGLWDFPSVL